MDKEARQESSVPVVTRVGMVQIANLIRFWEKQGYYVRTMSQLISWSIDLLTEELSRNKLIPVECKTIVEAHRELTQRGLYQRSMLKRAERKISTAMGFEALRAEGVEPREYAPEVYRAMHPRNQVQERPAVPDYSPAEVEAARARAKEQIAEMIRDGRLAEPQKGERVVKEGMSEEEFYRLAQEREAEEAKKWEGK